MAARIDLDKALEEKGLTRETQLRLLEAAEKFCGPGEVLSAIDAYSGILEM